MSSNFYPPTVATWFSYISFMRWGFEGTLQVQFRGVKVPVTIGNMTIELDGIKVSLRFKTLFCFLWWTPSVQLFQTVFQVVEMMKMNQYPLYSCYLVLITVALVFMLLYFLSLRFIKQKSSQDWWDGQIASSVVFSNSIKFMCIYSTPKPSYS